MNIKIKYLFKSFFWFGLVGFSAMFIHFYTVTAILIPLHIHPLIANTAGFLTAFIVSYYGHAHLTFHNPRKKNNASFKNMQRFFMVAIIGFLLNQIIFYILLRFSNLDIDLSLGITLMLVSGSTYILSKYWAFKISGND